MTKPHKPPYMPVCGGCGTHWSGNSRAHCGTCHETFSGLTAFEAHRQMVNKRQALRVCVPPTDAGLVKSERGYWCNPPDSRGEWWKDLDEDDDD